jgi:hypothetical protein
LSDFPEPVTTLRYGQSVVTNTSTMHEWWILTSRPKCCVYR